MSNVNIAGIGLCSSLGGFDDACAAHRAGLNRFQGHSEIVVGTRDDTEPTPLKIAPAANNLNTYQGIARLVKLCEFAFRDLEAKLENRLPLDSLCILMVLPPPDERVISFRVDEDASLNERLKSYLQTVTDALFVKIGHAFHQVPLQANVGDRVSFARVVQKSCDLLSKSEYEQVLILAADSLLCDETLEFQLHNERLLTDDNPVGYIPGEGAAAMLLTREATKHSLKAVMRVEMDSSTIDQDDRDVVFDLWQGQKMMALMENILIHDYHQRYLPKLITDQNGEELRAIEMGCLQVKLKQKFPNSAVDSLEMMSASFGELGAVTGPFAMAHCLASIKRNYAKLREFVILLSERNGKRACIYLTFGA